MKRILAFSIGLAGAFSPQIAEAKLACYPLAHIERALDAEYGESRRFAGKAGTGIEFRLYVNAKTGTWSWIGIPAGAEVGCLIFAGRADAAAPAEPPAPPRAHF